MSRAEGARVWLHSVEKIGSTKRKNMARRCWLFFVFWGVSRQVFVCFSLENVVFTPDSTTPRGKRVGEQRLNDGPIGGSFDLLVFCLLPFVRAACRLALKCLVLGTV